MCKTKFGHFCRFGVGLLLVFAFALFAFAPPADARSHAGGSRGGGSHGGAYHGGGHGGGDWYGGWAGAFGLGILAAPFVAWDWPYYYGWGAPVSVYDYPPALTVDVPPPLAVTQTAPVAPAAVWYYCGKPAGYYPYVQSCGVPWRKVPISPPQ
jgi:hypothetical protein